MTTTATILITMDDLETAVPLNAAFEEAGFDTALVSSLDDARRTVKRVKPDLVILAGAVHESRAAHLAELAREQEIPSLALLEATDSDQGPRSARLGDERAVLRETMRWLDRINDDSRPARLDQFLQKYGEAREQENVSELIGALATARKRWQRAQRRTGQVTGLLPGFNGMSE